MTGAASIEGPTAAELITAAARALKDQRDEVNRLNVFPVPDGDTGTNMSLTMDAVLVEVAKLAPHPTMTEVCQAVTHGSLMGARGNSGVILSQILRGVCEGLAAADYVDAQVVADALARSVTVAFQAVRKPVEGTMLTVLRDASDAAVPVAAEGTDIGTLLEACVEAAFESVRRTPELLPVLKEAGVVDAGGYGLAILAEGFVAGLAGHEIRSFDVTVRAPVSVEDLGEANDWDDTEHLYCTEFLLFGSDLDRKAVGDYLSTIGGSVLAVGSPEELKIHVHTDTPTKALDYALQRGEVAEVHVHNMRRQTAARKEALLTEAAEHKAIGFVAVAAGEGLARILESLGVDAVVSGGQTMNPSTAELLAAIDAVPAREVVILPNNRNIILAANQTVGLASKPVAVVPTTAVPQAFSALLAADPTAPLDENVAAMTEAAEAVRTGEITTAIKDSKGKAGRIKAGQTIGIADHEIEAVGSSVLEVARRLLDAIIGDADSLTLLAGVDLADADLAEIAAALQADHPDLEIDSLRGEQPLYPLLMAVE